MAECHHSADCQSVSQLKKGSVNHLKNRARMKNHSMPRQDQALVAPAIACLAITLVDCILLQRKYFIFTGGFMAPSPLKGIDIVLFLMASLWIDATLTAPIVWLSLYALSKLHVHNPVRRAFIACLVACLPIGVVNVIKFEILRYFGNTVEFALLREIAGGSFATMFSFASSHLVGMIFILIPSLILSGAVYFLLGYLPGRLYAMLSYGSLSLRARALCAAVLLLGSPVVMFGSAQHHDALYRQLDRKMSGNLIGTLADVMTDFDRDGYGLVVPPSDRAPFNSRLHPYAIDMPGNDIDENGINGDLKARGDFEFENDQPAAFTRKPDFVLFVLESFRADNMGVQSGDRPITPVLNQIISAGAVFGIGYSHNSYTSPSLKNLFQGCLTFTAQSTLIDDFLSNGYLVGCISAQDEDFSNIKRDTGMARAHYFVDAKNNATERISNFAASGSLVVPWTVVARNVQIFLAQEGAKKQPIFLYINLQDCHYPYNHYAMKPLVATKPMERNEIEPGNAIRVQQAYRNAAANVDMAVGQILEEFTRIRHQRPCFVIVGDHGESLFENGALGHGIEMCMEQNQIPIIAEGMPSDCVFPMGLAEIRGMIRKALSTSSSEQRQYVDPRKWVFLFIGHIDYPVCIGAATEKGGVSFNFKNGKCYQWGKASHASLPPLQAIAQLWEQIALHRAESKGEAK